MFNKKCKHELSEISKGFSIGSEGVSPTILECKKCSKYFEIDTQSEDIDSIREIEIKESE